MTRSFRFQLALRATAGVVLGSAALSAVTLLTLRAVLDRELDRSILSVASIQAGSLADGATAAMHFHEWDITPDEVVLVRDLVRYAQVWQSDGVSLLRAVVAGARRAMHMAIGERPLGNGHWGTATGERPLGNGHWGPLG